MSSKGKKYIVGTVRRFPVTSVHFRRNILLVLDRKFRIAINTTTRFAKTRTRPTLAPLSIPDLLICIAFFIVRRFLSAEICIKLMPILANSGFQYIFDLSKCWTYTPSFRHIHHSHMFSSIFNATLGHIDGLLFCTPRFTINYIYIGQWHCFWFI